MARPSLGVRAPPLLAPGIAGRRSGTGEGPVLDTGRDMGVMEAGAGYTGLAKDLIKQLHRTYRVRGWFGALGYLVGHDVNC